MDPVIERVPRELLGHMNQAELTELIRLLELARSSGAELPPANSDARHH
jgi:hypothetical protein